MKFLRPEGTLLWVLTSIFVLGPLRGIRVSIDWTAPKSIVYITGSTIYSHTLKLAWLVINCGIGSKVFTNTSNLGYVTGKFRSVFI